MLVILAHGALGNFDELIFFGVAFIFIVMMGISWVRSRNVQPDFDEAPSDIGDTSQEAEVSSPDHFKLD